MTVKNISGKIFIYLISVLLIFVSFAPQASCDQLNNIKKKQKVTHEKIKHLKVLEHLEKNKLYKNQQRLEDASVSLQNSKSRYNSLESSLAGLERDLNNSVAEYNKANIQMRTRIRQVFKNQRIGMFDLIFNAKDLNSLLDVVYFEKIVLKQDYNRMITVKVKSQKIAKMKADIEARRAELAQSIQSINSQQKYIKNAIARNQSMINKYKTDRATYERACKA